jgi:hypothetical protein
MGIFASSSNSWRIGCRLLSSQDNSWNSPGAPLQALYTVHVSCPTEIKSPAGNPKDIVVWNLVVTEDHDGKIGCLKIS